MLLKIISISVDLPVVFGFFAVLILVLHLNFYALYFASTFQIRFFDIRSEKALLTKGFDRQDDDAGQMDRSFPGADCRYSIKGNSGEEKI